MSWSRLNPQSLFLAWMLLVGVGPTAVLAHSAVEPVAREEAWGERQQLLNHRAAEGKEAQIIFVGDSITQGWEDEGKVVWQKYYAARGAINLGMHGDQTQHVLWRLEHGNLDGIHPKLTVLMIGTNNLYGSAYSANTVVQVADGVSAIVQLLKRKLPDTRILLLGILPRGENPNPMRGDVLQVNEIIQNLADNRTVLWSDFGARFVNSDGTIHSAFMPDYLHLSPAGYRLWAEAIEEQISSILGDRRIKPEPP